jgi:hypothetical protein
MVDEDRTSRFRKFRRLKFRDPGREPIRDTGLSVVACRWCRQGMPPLSMQF